MWCCNRRPHSYKYTNGTIMETTIRNTKSEMLLEFERMLTEESATMRHLKSQYIKEEIIKALEILIEIESENSNLYADSNAVSREKLLIEILDTFVVNS